MVSLSTESTPRERLARVVVLLKRTKRYWKSAAAIAVVGVVLALLLALSTSRIYRSETTVVYRDAVRAGRDGENPAARASKMGPRLKELVLARPRLSAVIEEMGLYPELAQRSILLAVDEMQKNISFRARTQDTFVISFTHQDPVMAQKVTARLAEVMIEDYSQDSLDAASLTHDFMKRELEEANKSVEDSSRALARFLARHPQFTWGLNDSPYAPTAPAPAAGLPLRRQPAVPNGPPPDPVIVQLNQRLAQIDAELSGGRVGVAPEGGAGAGAPPPATASDAQKQRDAAAAALATAETELRSKLVRLTPVHPDAMAAKSKVEGARAALAAAENNLRLMRTGAAVPPPPPVATAALDPQRREDLDRERRTITGQLAARRSELAKTSATAPMTTAERDAVTDEANKDVVELETEWHKLRLDLERARDHFRKVQDKERVASLSAAAAERESQEELVVVDPAYVPVRPDKGRGRVFFAGSFVAIFFALGFAGARVMLNDTLFDESDVEAVGGPPLLVALPHISPQGAVDAPPSSTLVTMPQSSSFDGPYSPYSPRSHGVPPSSMAQPPVPSIEDTMPPMTAPPAAQRVIHLGPTPLEQEQAAQAPHAPGMKLGVDKVEGWLSGEDSAFEADEPTMQSGRAPQSKAPKSTAAVESAPATNESGFARSDEEKPSRPLSVRPPPGPGPVVLDEPSVEVVGLPFDPESEGAIEMLRGAPIPALGALRVLRHRLEKVRQGKPMVVSFVSPGEGEGKSTVAARLAMTLAEAERARVVLVEGNLMRPRLAQMLGLRVPEDMGMSSQIRRRHMGRWEPWNVVRIGASLFVLAEPGPEASFPGALHSTWFEQAIRALRESYDYVVIDGCPVLGSGDANVLEEVSDTVILLARSGVTRASALSRAARQLGDRRVFGVVLNDVSPARRARKKNGGAHS